MIHFSEALLSEHTVDAVADLIFFPHRMFRNEMSSMAVIADMKWRKPVAQKEPFKSSFVLLLAGHISHALMMR